MVVDNGFRLFVGNTVTGLITADIPASATSWGQRLNDAGAIDCTIPIRSKEVARLGIRAATAPLHQFMGISYGDTILEAGPIWKRAYEPDKETLKVTAGGLWSILDTIKALNWVALAAGTSPTQVTLDVVGKTLGSIARELVRISIQTNPNNPGLPIVLPDILAGINERHESGYTLPWLGQLLKNLTAVQRGPDIRFRPRFRADDARYVEWVMETGTDLSPLLTQSGPDWVWDGSVERSGVVGFGVVEDASNMAARAWQPGAGSEQNMKLKWAQDTTLIDTAGYPWTEVDVASKDVEDLNLLQGYANAGMAAAKYPVEQWSVSVRANLKPLLGTYLPGDWAKLIIPDSHPILDPGDVRVRMMAIDGDHTETVKISLAPIGGRA
ncbi:hypothetical protein MB46_10420 [Arthrobacter alpinus]|uniref:hypothetical protein n=1 Tax=Arthrobacter alpinus TaxID=656366 RepID=UPI0005CA5897|nr:hypothetical protein [Arthrobacter alpinus]ALV45835.1 hypothetical protein MB46_10420 [Arthrobacter alpinus]